MHRTQFEVVVVIAARLPRERVRERLRDTGVEEEELLSALPSS